MTTNAEQTTRPHQSDVSKFIKTLATLALSCLIVMFCFVILAWFYYLVSASGTANIAPSGGMAMTSVLSIAVAAYGIKIVWTDFKDSENVFGYSAKVIGIATLFGILSFAVFIAGITLLMSR